MNYSFSCPAPCKREIKVDANDHLDAVEKMIMAGAMSCRNVDSQCSCQHARLDMPPIPREQLRRIVSLCTREELRHLYQELMINAMPKGEGKDTPPVMGFNSPSTIDVLKSPFNQEAVQP